MNEPTLNIFLAIGVGLTFLVSVASAVVSIVSAKAQNRISGVSRVRYEWGTCLREYSASFFAAVDSLCLNSLTVGNDEVLRDLQRSKWKIIMLLGPEDEALRNTIEDFSEATRLYSQNHSSAITAAEIHNQREALYKDIQFLIFREWSKQKDEARIIPKKYRPHS